MKKICIALDYNPSAEKVAEIGYAYANALKAETTLVHVITDARYYSIDYSPIMGYAGTFANSTSKVGQELALISEKFLLASAQHLGNKNIKTLVLQGETDVAILEYCNKNHIDLLVIGTHSHSTLENVLMGNTAVKVVRHAKIPILIIPTKTK